MTLHAMSPGPIQTILLILCAASSVGLFIGLFLRPQLAYVRWIIIAGISASMTLDAASTWLLPGPTGGDWTGPYLAVELFGAFCWLLFSRRYARSQDNASQSALGWTMVFLVSVLLGTIAASSALLCVPTPASMHLVYKLTAFGFAVRAATLVVIIMSLTSLEATLVNSVHGQRWRIKFTILGAIAIQAAQLFTLSLSLLYHSLDLTLSSARQTGFVIGVGLLLFSTLFRGGETPVMMSKRLARTSVVLFGSGAYLVFLAALGLAMSLTGNADNKALLIALGILVGVGLLTLLLSERFRRKFTRILQHYFYKEKYDYRVQWLAFTRRLSSARTCQDLYQAILLGFCETIGMGGAVLYLMETNGSALIPAKSWEVPIAPPRLDNHEQILRQAREGAVAIDVRKGFDKTESNVQAYFIDTEARYAVPLMKDDCLNGLVLLTKPIDETEDYNQEDFDLIEALATQATSALLNFRLADLLSQARDMEVIGRVSAFIVHDLKNLVYTLSLITDNAKRYISDPEFQKDMIKSLENTVSKMHVLITQLRQLPNRDSLHLELTDLAHLILETFKHTPIEDLDLGGVSAMAMVDRVQIGKVILNLVLNARESSQDGVPVTVETGNDGSPYFKVIDKGCGMSPQFINECLFQPFKTTKAKGIGIGLYQCKHIVEAHGGCIEVASRQGAGTTFTVRFSVSSASVHMEGA